MRHPVGQVGALEVFLDLNHPRVGVIHVQDEGRDLSRMQVLQRLEPPQHGAEAMALYKHGQSILYTSAEIIDCIP